MAAALEKQNHNQVSENKKYQNIQMDRQLIIEKLRAKGSRITKQRELLLNIILEQDCTSCKEIICQALKRNRKIGAATVYRMINELEEIGAISRKITYSGNPAGSRQAHVACTVVLDGDRDCRLGKDEWEKVIQTGLGACGYLEEKEVVSIRLDTGL